MEKLENKHICKVPFFAIEIDINGEVTVCCPYKNPYSIGNVYEKPFDEIWYSENAKILRQEILSYNYAKCNLNICNPTENIEQDKLELMDETNIKLIENPPYPKYVKFCHDSHCNIKCITCRDYYKTNNPDRNKFLDSHIEKTFLPILKNCEIVSLNGSGEVFASSHCKNLIKAIVKTYPNIKFDLHTNGLLCNKNLCDKLGITEKIISVDISMSAMTEKTYNKIMIGSNFKTVINNIEWLSELKNNGILKRLDLYFVVQALNYKEMTDFIKFATRLDADVYFWEYRDWGTKFGRKYKKIAVFMPYHKYYNKFARMLQEPIFKQKNVHLNNFLKTIKPISKLTLLKFKFNVFKKQVKTYLFLYKMTTY